MSLEINITDKTKYLMKDFLKYMSATVVGLIVFSILTGVIGMMCLVGMIAASSSTKEVSDNSVLVVNMSGMLNERSENTFMDEIGGSTVGKLGLDDVLSAIKKAKNNDKIKGIYIEAGMLSPHSYASLTAIRNDLIDFKKSGKWIIAYGDVYTQGNYYVASVADNATEGNHIDASLLSITTAGGTYSVNDGAPEGDREILMLRKLLYAPGDNGSVAYRIPSMVILPNGNIVTAIDRRWNSEADLANRIDIIARISEDGGYTWSEEYTIAEATDDQNGRGDCAMVVAANGDIVAAFVGGNSLWNSTEADPMVSFISRSSDGGKTWITLRESISGIGSGAIFGNESPWGWLGGFGVNYIDQNWIYGCSMSSAITGGLSEMRSPGP